MFLDIENDFFLPIDIALTFHNFFDSVGINQWDSLKALIEIDLRLKTVDRLDELPHEFKLFFKGARS